MDGITDLTWKESACKDNTELHSHPQKQGNTPRLHSSSMFEVREVNIAGASPLTLGIAE
jgi:hypothetical protein